MSFSRLAKRLTIKAFSATTFKLHISSWTSLLTEGEDSVTLSLTRLQRTLQLLSLQAQKGTMQSSNSLSPNHIKLVKTLKRDLLKETKGHRHSHLRAIKRFLLHTSS